jgi:hypothetical protein
MRGYRGASDVVEPLEHLRPASGPGQVRGGDQAVVPAADNDDIGPLHRSAKVALDLTSWAHSRRSGIAAGLAQRPALPQQIPALIEFHFHGAQALVLLGFVDLMVLQLVAQLLLLGDQLVYLSENVLVLGHESRLR